MKLHPPFIISARLAPALRVADATLSLVGVNVGAGREGRDMSGFVLDFDDGTSYRDERMSSGCGGFHGTVGIFANFLGFMGACGESVNFTRRTGRIGECNGLFPEHIAQWCADNQDEITDVEWDLYVEPGSDMPNEDLIEEE